MTHHSLIISLWEVLGWLLFIALVAGLVVKQRLETNMANIADSDVTELTTLFSTVKDKAQAAATRVTAALAANTTPIDITPAKDALTALASELDAIAAPAPVTHNGVGA